MLDIDAQEFETKTIDEKNDIFDSIQNKRFIFFITSTTWESNSGTKIDHIVQQIETIKEFKLYRRANLEKQRNEHSDYDDDQKYQSDKSQQSSEEYKPESEEQSNDRYEHDEEV